MPQKNSEQLDLRIQEIEKGIDAKVAAAVEKSDKAHDAKIRALEDELNMQINFVQSFTFTLQGKGQLAGSPTLAMKSFILALGHLIGGNNEREIQVVINLISDDCLPKMNNTHLKPLASGYDPEKDLSELITKLETNYPNGRYSLSIAKFRRELADAKKR